MKMYLVTLALCLISHSFAFDAYLMENNAEKVAIVLGKTVNDNGIITKLHGIVAKSDTGHLECKLTYNSSSDKYSGTLINKRYSYSEWYSHSLDNQKAQEYYKLLTECLNK